MKILIPLLIALVGLGAGVGAGLFLRPAPEPSHEASADCGHGEVEPCRTAEADPFKTTKVSVKKHEEELTYVPMDKPFVVPVFTNEKVTAMMVVSLSVATVGEDPELVHALEPRLRDRFLEVMFLHSNSGGFSGSFTTGRKMEDLKTALLKAARQVMGAGMVTEVLVTEINRQDV